MVGGLRVQTDSVESFSLGANSVFISLGIGVHKREYLRGLIEVENVSGNLVCFNTVILVPVGGINRWRETIGEICKIWVLTKIGGLTEVVYWLSDASLDCWHLENSESLVFEYYEDDIIGDPQASYTDSESIVIVVAELSKFLITDFTFSIKIGGHDFVIILNPHDAALTAFRLFMRQRSCNGVFLDTSCEFLLTPIVGELGSEIELVALWATDHSDIGPLNETAVCGLSGISNKILCS